jgi:Bacterial Ig-like domain/WD40-like Beta Propeller Repeat
MHYKSGGSYPAWSVAWALIFSACSADRLSAPITRADFVPDFVPVISRPIVRFAVTNVRETMARSSLSVADAVSYVSLVPGSIPGGSSITITNVRSGVTITGALKDGGLDPVPIPASIGDTLKFVAVDSAGALRITLAAVRSVSALTIVRTNPARGRASIPLNSSIQVVFSEPVAPATATNQNIFVRRGADPLDGGVVASADGISVEFRPSLPLITGEQYTLVVTAGITNQAGDHLAGTTEVPFTIWAGGNGIVFMSTRTGNPEIFFMKPDGSGVVNLTKNPAGSLAASGDPAWSSDGTQIAFDSDRNGTSHIFLMQSDGSGVHELTSGTTFDTSPSWSPDGTMIVFGRCCTYGMSDLFIIRTDGTQLKKITSGDGYAENPAWSPDGSRIAFDYAIGGLRPDIYLIQPDGTGLTQVTTDPHRDLYPAWTPDGKWLSFSTDRVDGVFTIWFSKPDGSEAFLCDEIGTRAVGMTYSSDDSTADVFTSNATGSDNIFLSTSSGLHNLTHNSFENRSASWARK